MKIHPNDLDVKCNDNTIKMDIGVKTALTFSKQGPITCNSKHKDEASGFSEARD
jgi:hypothetical protein